MSSPSNGFKQFPSIISIFAFISILSIGFINAQEKRQLNLAWEAQESGIEASLRGISAFSKDLVWVSGSGGQYAFSNDGGKNWTAGKVPEADSLDFRDIHVFSSEVIYLMGAGPGEKSRVYKTIDGGKTWQLQFTNPHAEGFFSSMGFWDEKNGLVFSDPVGGKYVIYKTKDGGESWQQIPPENIPVAKEGEYAFAASGTCLITGGESLAWIGSGGKAARVFFSTDRGNSWQVAATPMIHGEASTGIFSLAFQDEQHGVMVGGNYQAPEKAGQNVALTNDGGKTWRLLDNPDAMAYRSCVRYVPYKNGYILIAVGRSGSSYSTDGGETWQRFTETGYYTFDNAPTGECWAAGADGRVAKLVLSEM